MPTSECALLPWLTTDDMQRPLAALALVLLCLGIASCGSGSGSSPGPLSVPTPSSASVTTLPDQSECAAKYRSYALPSRTTFLTGPDPLLIGRQWHLRNTGQSGGTPDEDIRAMNAWELGFTGSGVRLAIVDDAVETLHADLFPNLLAGSSFNYRSGVGVRGTRYPLPCNITGAAAGDTHGTAVAGLAVAALDNAIGGAGVAPAAALVALNPLSTNTDFDIADSLQRDLATTAIFNSSWGSPDDGILSPVPDSFRQAINAGLSTGRGGLGAIYVFASGNGGCLTAGCTTASANHESTGLDGYLNHMGVIAACAVDHNGVSPYYAEPGANQLVCGPSGNAAVGVTTTQVLDTWRFDFSGSSASAPQVSGVVALMLQANPSLSWRDVRIILARSARLNHPNSPQWTRPAGGHPWHPYYGFGVANAEQAVRLAGNWATVGTSSTLKSCTAAVRNPQAVIPDASRFTVTPLTDTVTIGADCPITALEYVEVAFSADHPYSGDLRIRLTSPNGLVSPFVDARTCVGTGDACGTYMDWRFGSVRHLDEAPQGPWTLQVTDMTPGHSGTGIWQSWTLRLWGR